MWSYTETACWALGGSILLLISVAAWIASNCPIPWRDSNLSAMQQKRKKSLASEQLYFTKPSSIVYPWKEASGLMKMMKVPCCEWLELDGDAKSESEAVRTDKASKNTFLIHSDYQAVAFSAGLELLDLIVDFINESVGGGPGAKVSRVIRKVHGEAVLSELVINSELRWKILHDVSRASGFTCMLDSYDGAYHPLQVCRFLVAEDLNLLHRNTSRQGDHTHVLIASALSFPDRWHLESKLGLPLAAIHYPVNTLNVANESLLRHSKPSQSPIVRAMEKFFDSLYEAQSALVDKDPFIHSRMGYGFQSHPYQTNRYYDQFTETREALRSALEWQLGERIERIARSATRRALTRIINACRGVLGVQPLELFLRTERQTFRLLPVSECVAFTIRTRVTAISNAIESADEARFLSEALAQVSERDNSSKDEFKHELMGWLDSKLQKI